MACFIVPAAEGAVVKVIERRVERGGAGDLKAVARRAQRLRWLSDMLWGGSGLLAFEHVWHGEVVPFAPFLTAMQTPADALSMVREMATVGVGMALAVTAAWGVMCAVASAIERRANEGAAVEVQA